MNSEFAASLFGGRRALAWLLLLALLGGCDSDGAGGDDNVAPVPVANRAPVAGSDKVTVVPGASTVVRILDNDRDPDGDTLSIASVTTAPGATVLIDNAGTPNFSGDDFLIVRADDGYAGAVTIDYTVVDPSGATGQSSVSIEVVARTGNNGNRIPMARADNVATPAAVGVVIDVLANDSDPDGSSLAIARFSMPSNGVLALDNAGTPAVAADDFFRYIPATGFAGADSFTYDVTDGTDTVTAAVRITVSSSAGLETVTGRVSASGAKISIYAIDSAGRAQGPALLQTVSDVAGEWAGLMAARNSLLLVQARGGFFLDDQAGLDNIANARGPALGNADVFETLLPPETNFAAQTVLSSALLLRARLLTPDSNFDDALARSRGEFTAAFGFDVLTLDMPRPLLPATASVAFANHVMLLGGAANHLNAVGISLLHSVPTSSMLAAQIRDLSDCRLDGRDLAGPVTLDISGASIAMPVPGDLATQTLRFRNNFAGQFGAAALPNLNPAACASLDSAKPIFDRVPATIDIAAVTSAGTSSTSAQVVAAIATVIARDNGQIVSVTNDAPATFPTGVTTVTFTAVNAAGNSATVQVDFVVADMTAPTITPPPAILTAATGPLTVVALGSPAVNDNVTTLSNLVVSNDAPASGFAAGLTIVNWRVTDEAGLTATATQAVTITSAGSPTVVTPIADQSLTQGLAFSLDAAAAFSDPNGDALSFALLGRPPGSGISIDPTTGTISGTPTNADALASPLTLTVAASDGSFTTGNSFTVLVANINDAPTISAPLADLSVSENAPVSIATASAFTDIDGDMLSFAVVNLPPGLSLGAASGVISGTVDDTAVAGSPWTITVTASDGSLGVSDVFRLTVTNVNDAPIVVSAVGSQSATQGVPFTLNVAGVFSDDDGDTLTLSVAGLPASMSLDASGLISGTPTNAEALIANFGITLTASDGQGGNSTTSFVLAIANTNDAPTVTSPIGPQNAVEDAAFGLDVSAAFTDIDGDALTFSAVGLPPTLTLNASGTISGTPTNADFLASPFAVTVTAMDPRTLTVTDTFSLSIANTNDAPTIAAIADPAATDEDTVIGPIGITIGDAETAPGALSVSATSSNPALLGPGQISLGGSGAVRNVTLTPVSDANGSATITITVSDGTDSATESFTVNVTARNDAPLFTLSAGLALTEDFTGSAQVTVSPLPPPSDETAQTVTYALAPVSVPWANLAFNAGTGTVTVTAVADASGSGAFTITADDAQAVDNTYQQVFNLSVAAAPDAPQPGDDTFNAGRDEAQRHDVLNNDSDPDGDPLSLISVTSPTAAGGSVVINDAGTPGVSTDDFIDYVPAVGYTGADSYSYSVSDGALSNSATVTISVSASGYVASVVPAAGAVGVAVDADIVITFSEPMNAATMTSTNLILSTTSSGAPAVSAPVVYAAGPMTATITPDADLASNTQYWVIVSNLVENAGGTRQGFDYRSSFITESADSDGDGISDSDEVALAATTDPCLSAADPDSDNDGLSDGVEIAAGSDPCFNDPGQTRYYVDVSGPSAGWPSATSTLPDPPGSGSPGSPTMVLLAAGVFNEQLDFNGGCDDVTYVGSLDPGSAGQQPVLGPNGEPTTVIDMGGGRNSEFDDCANIELRNIHLRDGTGNNGEKGGGLRVSGTTTAVLDGVWFTDSTVDDQGGGLGVSNSSVATVRNSVLRDNVVTGGKGGGGIWVGANATLNLEDSLVINNSAAGVGGGGVYFDPNATGVIRRSIISGNQASGNDGGGVFILGATANVTIDDTVITGNRAANAGGGIYVDSAPSTLRNLLIAGNRADTQGGGLAFAGSGGLSASNLTVIYNESANAGAGASALGSQPQIIDSVFFNNRRGGRNVAQAANAGDTFSAVGNLQSDFNLVELDADGAGDIDLTALARTPDFEGGYYLNQSTSLAVDSGSRTSLAANLATAFTDASGNSDDSVVDRGWHYASELSGVADSVSIVSPLAGLAAFAASPQSVTVTPLASGSSTGVGRYVVFRLVSAPPGFAWANATSLEPAGPGTVLADDVGNGSYQVRVDLSATAAGSADFEVWVDGTSLGTIAVAINP